jgi:hypothetical protein
MTTENLRINLPKSKNFTTCFFQQQLQILTEVDIKNSYEIDSIMASTNIIDLFCKANKVDEIQNNMKNLFAFEKPRLEDILAIAKFHGYDLVESTNNESK